MPLSKINTSEMAILSRVLEPDKPTFTAAAARAILALEFHQADKERMHQLSVKAQEGTLTRREQAELNNFEKVGHLIGLMQSKARRSLKNRAVRERQKQTSLTAHGTHLGRAGMATSRRPLRVLSSSARA